MDNSLYVAYAALQADMKAVDIAANNLANINTNGYREVRTFFSALEAAGGTYPSLGESKTKHDPGPLVSTGRPLDVAVEGPGFLVIGTPEGRRYTRDGSLSLDASGTLVTRDGLPVQGQGGPITIDTTRGEPVTIDPEGRIFNGEVQEGRILLVDVDHNSLVHESGSRFRSQGAPEEPLEDGRLQQGFLERSNVELPSGDLDQLRRHFQSLSRALQVINGLDRRIIGMATDGAQRQHADKER